MATSVTDTGWYAEIRIPFRTLKFNSSDIQTWGVNFERKVRRLNEDSYWSPLPRIYDIERVSLAGSVEELRGLRPGKNLRVKPFAASSSSTIGGRGTDGDFDAGLDVKYGVTTGLVWDFTVNTDFSQVEADEQQINLSRFSLRAVPAAERELQCIRRRSAQRHRALHRRIRLQAADDARELQLQHEDVLRRAGAVQQR